MDLFPPTLPHQPYFAALTDLEGEEESPRWQGTVAGLVVLRLVDRWIESQHDRAESEWIGCAMSADELGPGALGELVEATRATVGAVDATDRKRVPLLDVLDAVVAASRPDLAEALLLYAHVLHSDAEWTLAGDVYDTVHRLAIAAGSDGLDTLEPIALERLGHSRRMTGDLEGATQAYEDARAAASTSGDTVRELRVRISQANLLIHVGNLPAAAVALAEIVAEARGLSGVERARRPACGPALARLPFLDIDLVPADIIALATHDRGHVASVQGELVLALEQFFSAWQLYREPVRRERAWFDLAYTLAALGLNDAARDAYVILHLTAGEREVRLSAAINLLELAVCDGERDAAWMYRQELEAAAASGALPARLAPWVAYYTGTAEARFGEMTTARASWEQAITLAKRAQVNEVIIRADASLAGALSCERPSRDPALPAVTLERLHLVTDAIHRLRWQVGPERATV